ncbi:MAG TPA: PAS domain-containing protein, partial [Ktedonobacterales bacterium]|nr:PAS domain-containing protein [Ktedonobacterales bacterium]
SMLERKAPAEQLAGQRVDTLLPTIADIATAPLLGQVASSGTPFSAVMEDTTTRPGKTLYRRCTLSPLQRSSPQAETLLLTLLDVTEQVILHQRTERSTEQLKEYERQSTVRQAVAAAIARGTDLSETLSTIAARIAQHLGDCCAIFLPDEAGSLWPWALVHRNPMNGEHLRASFLQQPPQWGQGGLGGILSSGTSILRTFERPDEVAQFLGISGALAQTLGIWSVACTPLRDAMDSFGLLLVFSSRLAAGGSDRVIVQGDLEVLGEIADEIALVAENARVQLTLHASRTRLDTVLSLVSDGVALYDAQGQLQYANEAGKRLLSPPEAQSREVAVRQMPPMRALLAPDGRPLSEKDLPISRALRGEQVGTEQPEPLTIEWEGGRRRNVLMRAAPVRDTHGTVDGVVLLLRADESQPAEPPGPRQVPRTRALTDPLASASDLGELCARVARFQSGRQRRRIEVRLPRTAIPLPESVENVEKLLATLTEAAIEIFPPEQSLVMQLWLEPVPNAEDNDNGSSVFGSWKAVPTAVVRISCPQYRGALPRSSEALTRAQLLANSLDGVALRHDDPTMGISFAVRLPVALTPR